MSMQEGKRISMKLKSNGELEFRRRGSGETNPGAPRPNSTVLMGDGSRIRAPFVVRCEENCEDCGGSGYDPGSLRPMEPDVCTACHGSGQQVVVRNYLAEAFRIAAGKSATTPQREHLEAVILHCRGLVQVLMSIPDIR